VVQKPDRSKIRYNADAVKNAAKRPSVPHGWWPFVVTDAEEFVGDTEKTLGDMVVKMTVAALQNSKDATSKIRPLMNERFTVPLDNPDVPGHIAKDWSYGLTAGTLRSLYDPEELLRPPRYNKETGETLFKGKGIEKDRVDAGREEALQQVVDLAADLYFGAEKGKAVLKFAKGARFDVKDLKGRVFLGKVGPDRKGEGFTNILARRHVDDGLPNNEQFCEAMKGAAGGATTAKAAPRRKKASKKKGK